MRSVRAPSAGVLSGQIRALCPTLAPSTEHTEARSRPLASWLAASIAHDMRTANSHPPAGCPASAGHSAAAAAADQPAFLSFSCSLLLLGVLCGDSSLAERRLLLLLLYTYHYTVTIRMTPASRWAATRAIVVNSVSTPRWVPWTQKLGSLWRNPECELVWTSGRALR